MLSCIIDNFEKYQTFIVGVIGFIGVIFTIHMNANALRNQHARQINQEKLAIRTALIEELTLLSNSYKDRIGMLSKEKCKGSALIPVNVPNDAYINLMPKLGLLTSNEIKLIMHAYQLAKELPIRLQFFTLNNNNSNEKPGYITIDRTHTEKASELHQNFLSNIEEALDEIKLLIKNEKNL